MQASVNHLVVLPGMMGLILATTGCKPPSNSAQSHSAAAPTTSQSQTPSKNPPREPTSKPWRSLDSLRGQFHPQHPDDLQVIVHDGGPRITQAAPELVWVTVDGLSDEGLSGIVLNQPHQLRTVSKGMRIKFVIAPGAPHPVMVTDKYLTERANWKIRACDKCGFDELFDAPSDLTAVLFPNVPEGATHEMFTSFCPLCGGVQVVQDKDADPTD